MRQSSTATSASAIASVSSPRPTRELIELEVELMKRELRRIGYADAVALWESKGDRIVMRDLTALPNSLRAAVAEVAIDDSGEGGRGSR